MPPILRGGSGPNSVLIYFNPGGSSGFSALALIAYPLRVLASKKFVRAKKK
jgi:hypothetical protein